MTYDGLVSRHLNRRLSNPIAALLANTPITPNQVTTLNLILAVATGAIVAAGWQIAGGILIQLTSVADGVDGALARLTGRVSRLGGIFDAVTDRYADAAILGGMGIYAARFEDVSRPEVAAAFALAGALLVSYSRARIEASLGAASLAGGRRADLVFGLASRDLRSLTAAVGTLAGFCYATLWLIGGLSLLTVVWRLLYLRFRPAHA